MKCPKCGSDNIKIVDYMNSKIKVCKDCNYDERDELEEVPDQRNTQREKRKFSPYRSGRK
jgi:ribosome-binding protein aMBF1 (putative translation factor)